MRKIILDLAVTLDGFIEGPNREVDWCILDEELGCELNEFIAEVDTILYGRTSYELFGNYIPPKDSPDSEKQFYESVNSMKKYVFSNTLTSVEGDATILSDNIKEQILKIKQQPGKNIWLFGGSGLITSLVNLNLVDEYWLGVHPTILGGGNPLFKDIKGRINLELINAKTFKSGVVSLYYKTLGN